MGKKTRIHINNINSKKARQLKELHRLQIMVSSATKAKIDQSSLKFEIGKISPEILNIKQNQCASNVYHKNHKTVLHAFSH